MLRSTFPLILLALLRPGLAVGQGLATAAPTPNAQTASPAPPVSAYDPLGAGGYKISPLTQPTLTPGVLQLLELEAKFASAVAMGGGKAFASWFADDAVTLNNGKAPVIGKVAISARAQWDPKEYQLTWQAQGAQMGPSNDMGFTWGHYDGTSKDRNGSVVKTSGRYFTVWKKLADGTWKVALDASSDEPQDAGECCVLPKP